MMNMNLEKFRWLKQDLVMKMTVREEGWEVFKSDSEVAGFGQGILNHDEINRFAA